MFLEGILFSIIIPFFMIWAVIEKCVNVTIVGKSEKKRKCVIFWCGQKLKENVLMVLRETLSLGLLNTKEVKTHTLPKTHCASFFPVCGVPSVCSIRQE